MQTFRLPVFITIHPFAYPSLANWICLLVTWVKIVNSDILVASFCVGLIIIYTGSLEE